jgi:hypothetical protein
VAKPDATTRGRRGAKLSKRSATSNELPQSSEALIGSDLGPNMTPALPLLPIPRARRIAGWLAVERNGATASLWALRDLRREVISWWTADALDGEHTWTVCTNGALLPRRKVERMGPLGFRAARGATVERVTITPSEGGAR